MDIHLNQHIIVQNDLEKVFVLFSFVFYNLFCLIFLDQPNYSLKVSTILALTCV